MGTSKLIPDTKYMDKADNLDFAAAFARIECHYFVNGIFLEEAFILKNVDKLSKTPMDIVQVRGGHGVSFCPWENIGLLPEHRASFMFNLLSFICILQIHLKPKTYFAHC